MNTEPAKEQREAVASSELLAHDPVDHPKHYTQHPSGVECITITEHMGFCLGNAMKYIWRAGEKGDAIEDLKKAKWYLDREIFRRSKPLSVEAARERRVCRFCKKDDKPGVDNPFLYNCGQEFAHKKCMEASQCANVPAERAAKEDGQNG